MRGPPIGAWGREHSRAAPSGGTVPGVPRLAPAALVAMALFAGCSTTDDSTATSSTTQAEEAPSPPSALGTASLPLGDGKYTTAPAKGSVFSCQRFGGGGGAFRDGPWIDVAAGTWDPAAKLAVRGSIDRHGSLTGRTSGGGETLTGNGLPTVPTGTFPIAADDPAYRYDRNPNSVTGYTLDVDLPAPETAPAPSCVGGTIGVSVLGVAIYSAFDAMGRDAAGHEVQDDCDGHPERTGQYHYHSLSSCWSDVAGFDPGLFGYALDGFGIYVQRTAGGALPSSAQDARKPDRHRLHLCWHVDGSGRRRAGIATEARSAGGAPTA